jgi:release factor glutamine methyltransferase
LTTIFKILQESIKNLTPVSDTPSLDAQNLLANMLGKSRSWVLAHPEANLSSQEVNTYQRNTSSIVSGIPLPYVLGHWEFFGLEIQITPDTLIPRPETELLVEKAMHWLSLIPGHCWGADVGTGSGCIAVALAKYAINLSIIASDISYPALYVARSNAIHHKLDDCVHFLQADLIPQFTIPLNLICANLPYIPTNTLKELEIYGKEPRLALDGGKDGLSLICKFLNRAPYSIAPGGLILLEIEANQGSQVVDLARESFPRAAIEVQSDLAGSDRLLVIQVPKDHRPVNL